MEPSLKTELDIKETLRRNLEELNSRIMAACVRSGRSPNDIKIVVSTKYVDHDIIRQLFELGIREVGENRVQEAQRKYEALKDPSGVALPLSWHMFGHLQRNKVKKALQLFELIHAVDSLRLTQEINETALAMGKKAKVLVEVNVSQEPQKYGLKEEEVVPLLKELSPMKGFQVLGLMCMTPISQDPEPSRPIFRHFREISEEVRQKGIENIEMKYLSMGMTQDFEVAVEEGSNLLRIGSILFRDVPRIL
ncbi:MAG TPA: YggS family pyridoxal phosphate-dependent enzyme [Candidatus Hypogeohydataceae bacterium YC41]